MDSIATEETDQEILGLLKETRTIAVVGMKDNPEQDAYRVPAYLQERGYTILPINPKLVEILDRTAYPSLRKIPPHEPPIDIVNIFRASEHIAAHADEILALSPRPRAVWTQLGIRDDPSAARLRAAGIQVIQDRCLMVDHARLVEQQRHRRIPTQGQLQIQVHYDFASSLCYVAHRMMERMRGFLTDLELRLIWTPVDLASFMGWPRNKPLDPSRLEHVRQLARALDVELRIPEAWLDSRPGAAIAVALGAYDNLEPEWREAVFSAIYQAGQRPTREADWLTLLDKIGATVTASELLTAADEVQRLTRSAAEQSVTGLPTFMLTNWPLGGIQDEQTMRSLLGRWARKQRSPN